MAEIAPLWTVHEVAEFFGCSASAVYKWTEKGPKRGATFGPRLPCIRVGALLRFVPAKVLAWAEAEEPAREEAAVLPLRSR